MYRRVYAMDDKARVCMFHSCNSTHSSTWCLSVRAHLHAQAVVFPAAYHQSAVLGTVDVVDCLTVRSCCSPESPTCMMLPVIGKANRERAPPGWSKLQAHTGGHEAKL